MRWEVTEHRFFYLLASQKHREEEGPRTRYCLQMCIPSDLFLAPRSHDLLYATS